MVEGTDKTLIIIIIKYLPYTVHLEQGRLLYFIVQIYKFGRFFGVFGRTSSVHADS